MSDNNALLLHSSICGLTALKQLVIWTKTQYYNLCLDYHHNVYFCQPLKLFTWLTSYCPLGFVAASILHRVLSLQTSPALATLIVCCSIASWILDRSCSRMLLNSSMQHRPPSASTRAPASSCHSPPSYTATMIMSLLASSYITIHTYIHTYIHNSFIKGLSNATWTINMESEHVQDRKQQDKVNKIKLYI